MNVSMNTVRNRSVSRQTRVIVEPHTLAGKSIYSIASLIHYFARCAHCRILSGAQLDSSNCTKVRTEHMVHHAVLRRRHRVANPSPQDAVQRR